MSFEPSAEQRALLPDVSGNDVNGLGETAPRRPSRVYWHRADSIAHGAVQDWTVRKFATEPALGDVFRGDRGPKSLEPVAATPAPEPAGGWRAALDEISEADDQGVAAFDPLWVYEGYDVAPLPWLVVQAVAIDMDHLKTAPEPEAALEVQVQYNRGTRAARLLANWIRAQGYQAEPHGGPWAGPVNLLPAAIQASLGELGKHGSLIHRRFGSSFRLAAVLTDMPLAADAPDVFGADDFCASCQVCARACPPDAISHAKQTVRGETKWYVDFDRCVPYFNEHLGCAICIAACPWSQPGVAPRLAEKMTRRRRNKT